MSSFSLLERNFQLTHEWLNEICEHLAWKEEPEAKNHALAILRIVLQQLRDNLPVEALSAQLPLLIRGLYFENWNPAVKAVFQMLTNRISAGEIEKLKHILPRPIRELWDEF